MKPTINDQIEVNRRAFFQVAITCHGGEAEVYETSILTRIDKRRALSSAGHFKRLRSRKRPFPMFFEG
jgi:hypothetical protein